LRFDVFGEVLAVAVQPLVTLFHRRLDSVDIDSFPFEQAEAPGLVVLNHQHDGDIVGIEEV